MEKLSKEEYIKRYSAKIQELLSVDEKLGNESAEASFVDWDGVYTPEEAAEDEAYYWAADC